MLDERDLQAISELMDKKLTPINDRLDNIETKLDELKEYAEETRGATNYMTKWIDSIEKKVDATA